MNKNTNIVFNSYYDVGYEGYIINMDTSTINKIRIGEVRINNVSKSEEYGFELIEDTIFGFINGKYSYKPFNTTYNGSYKTCRISANEVFENIMDVKLALRNYIEERARINPNKKLNITKRLLNRPYYETTINATYNIGDIVFIEDIFGSEILTATVYDYLLIKQKSDIKLKYVLKKSNNSMDSYSEEQIFISKDKIFNKRAEKYFNKFIIK